MTLIEILLLISVLALLGALGLYFSQLAQKKLLSKDIQSFQSRLEELQNHLSNSQSQISEYQSEREKLITQLVGIETEYKNLKEKHDDFKKDQDLLQERFELLASRILDQKSRKMDEQHQVKLGEILNPLKERIKTFEDKVERSHKETMERSVALREQILSLKLLNEEITKEAQNLTQALKGDSKTQGNWGELILESVLEKSGLVKDREYFLQKSFKMENGQMSRPDVIIHLPDEKRMVIDSKVSLKAYEQLVRSVEADQQKKILKLHAHSVKQHIDQLGAKKYHEVYQMKSPDFVLMFIPIDTAFAVALTHLPGLYELAFEKNIVIVTPSTLLATLKTVESLWRNEKQQRYALDIAAEAGKMYDKFVGFLNDMESLGQRIDQAQDSYRLTMNKLATGHGNLVNRAEKIKNLGAKASKQIEAKLIEEQDS